jgi:hypothetical protein
MYKVVLAGIAGFVLSGLMTIGTQASAEDFKGRMDCTVKTNQVIEVSDGIGKEYQKYTDSFEVGSSLLFEYQYVNQRLVVELTYLKGDIQVYYRPLNLSDTGQVVSLLGDGEIVRVQFNGGQNTTLSSDTITSDGVMVLDRPFRLEEGKLYFNRYYKNDWEGLVYVGWEQVVQVFTLDCRHKVDQLDDIIKSLTAIAGG